MRHKKGWLMSDSMSLSKVCWISTVLPGYGQIYNKRRQVSEPDTYHII